jgi:hypothetical protein
MDELKPALRRELAKMDMCRLARLPAVLVRMVLHALHGTWTTLI